MLIKETDFDERLDLLENIEKRIDIFCKKVV